MTRSFYQLFYHVDLERTPTWTTACQWADAPIACFSHERGSGRIEAARLGPGCWSRRGAALRRGAGHRPFPIGPVQISRCCPRACSVGPPPCPMPSLRSCSSGPPAADRGRGADGGALAAAGAAYQGLFRNPLVSPDILGVSAGCRARRRVRHFLVIAGDRHPAARLSCSARHGGLGLLVAVGGPRAASRCWCWCWPASCSARSPAR